jgi:uncharacterized membrane protein
MRYSWRDRSNSLDGGIMEQVAVKLIVANYEEENAAGEALKKLKDIEILGDLRFLDAAVIHRDDNNKIHIKETSDPGGGKGAAAGGTIGALIGVLAGPPGIVIGGAVGALVGGVTAKSIDSGIPNDRLDQLGEALSPGTSAVAVISETPFVDQVKRQLEKTGGSVSATHMRADIPDQLAKEESEVDEDASTTEKDVSD